METSIVELSMLLDKKIGLEHKNKGMYKGGEANKHPSQDVVAKLKALTPYDTAVYEYAKAIVDVRTASIPTPHEDELQGGEGMGGALKELAGQCRSTGPAPQGSLHAGRSTRVAPRGPLQ